MQIIEINNIDEIEKVSEKAFDLGFKPNYSVANIIEWSKELSYPQYISLHRNKTNSYDRFKVHIVLPTGYSYEGAKLIKADIFINNSLAWLLD